MAANKAFRLPAHRVTITIVLFSSAGPASVCIDGERLKSISIWERKVALGDGLPGPGAKLHRVGKSYTNKHEYI